MNHRDNLPEGSLIVIQAPNHGPLFDAYLLEDGRTMMKLKILRQALDVLYREDVWGYEARLDPIKENVDVYSCGEDAVIYTLHKEYIMVGPQREAVFEFPRPSTWFQTPINRHLDRIHFHLEFDTTPENLAKDWAFMMERQVFGRYTSAQLRLAFSIVADEFNWKNPIDKVIPIELVPVVTASIDFIAGGAWTVEVLRPDPKLARVTAPGYYNIIGS